MGICQSTNNEKQNKQPQRNHDRNNDNKVKSSESDMKQSIEINQINVEMNYDSQLFSPSKAQEVDAPITNPLNYNAICLNCFNKIAKIVSILYDKTQMTYVIKIKCSCQNEFKEYPLSSFKNNFTPKTNCDTHPEQPLTHHCNQCSVDLCQQCVDQKHTDHAIIEAINQPSISIGEFKQILNEQKANFTRSLREREKELNRQCDEFETLIHSIRNNGFEQLKNFELQNMNLLEFVMSSYTQYFEHKTKNQLSVGMINLANDLKINTKYDPNANHVEFTLSDGLNNLASALHKQIDDVTLKLNYDLFDKHHMNIQQYNNVNTIIAHTDNVICLLLLTNGRLASGSYDKTIKLWDLSDIDSQCEVITEKGNVLCFLEFTPGKLLTGTSANTISLWNIESKQSDFVFLGHLMWVNCLVKINQKHFGSGSNDKTIRIWDYYSRKLVKILKMESDCIFTLCLISENYLASGSGDNLIRIWNITEGTCSNWLKRHTKWVKCLCMLSNGHLLSGSDDHQIIVWNDSKYVSTLSGHCDSVRILSQINDHQFASGSFDTSIIIWNINSYEIEQTIMGHTSLVICIIPLNNKSFASCSNDKTIKIWY